MILRRNGCLEEGLGVLLLIACIGYLSSVTVEGLYSYLNYDEAYLLQAVESVANGRGYASYGALRGDGPWLFDPQLTTGPAVLLPLAAVWRVFGGNLFVIRVAMAIVGWCYILGALAFFNSSRWRFYESAIFLAASLAVSEFPMGRVLGELPAAAAVMMACAFFAKERPLLGALLLGLAIQIKVVFGVCCGVILLGYFVQRISLRKCFSWRFGLATICSVALPTCLFEIYRLVSFAGIPGYLNSLDELKKFLTTQSVNHSSSWLAEPNLLGSKLIGIYYSVPSFFWIVFALWLVGAALLSPPAFVGRFAPHLGSEENRTDSVALYHSLLFLVVAGSTLVLGWLVASSQVASRQALPFQLLSIPALWALIAAVFSVLKSNGDRLSKITASTMLTILPAVLSVPMIINIRNCREVDKERHAADQLHVAEILKASRPASIFADGWWQNPEYQVLTQIPAVPYLTGDRQMLVISDYQVNILGLDWAHYTSMCSEVVYSSKWTLVCWLPNFIGPNSPISVSDWGPREATAGTAPNTQSDGGAGIWMKLANNAPARRVPVKVIVGGWGEWLADVSQDGSILTVSLPGRLFAKSGSLPIKVRFISSSEEVKVGELLVK